MTVSALSDMLKKSITMLHEVGVHILSVTSDAFSSMWSAMKKLGCYLKYPNYNVTFPHPCNENEEIFYVPDVPHMLKLIRNLFCEKGEIISAFSNEIIRWIYIENLYKLQEQIVSGSAIN